MRRQPTKQQPVIKLWWLIRMAILLSLAAFGAWTLLQPILPSSEQQAENDEQPQSVQVYFRITAFDEQGVEVDLREATLFIGENARQWQDNPDTKAHQMKFAIDAEKPTGTVGVPIRLTVDGFEEWQSYAEIDLAKESKALEIRATLIKLTEVEGESI